MTGRERHLKPRTLKFNEGRACDAVVRYLEHREGSVASDYHRPEIERHRHPVELTFHLNNRLFAMEHTGIEPFEGFMRLDAEADRRVHRLVDLVSANVPQTEEFTLEIPLQEFGELEARDLDQVQDVLARWAIEVAPTLPVSASHILPRTPKISVPGIPFLVRLFRHKPIGRSKQFIVSFALSNLERKRLFRMKRALAKKCPKLAGWRNDSSARTVLVLEDNDIALTNQQFVADALLAAERDIAAPADEVYLVKTVTKIWLIWPIRVGDKTYYDVTDPDQRCWEVDSTVLVDLTQSEPENIA